MGRNRNPYQLHLVSPRAQSWVRFFSLSILMICLMRSARGWDYLLMIQPCTSPWKARMTAQHYKLTWTYCLHWETRWDMEFNPSKCQVVHVTGSRKTVKTDYVLHGQVMESVPCARYLGVDISSGLTWNSHIDRVTANANRTLGFIRRNIKAKMPKVREAAYNTLLV